MKPKVIRITTVAISMNLLLRHQLSFLNKRYHVIGCASYDPKHTAEVEAREGVRVHSLAMSRSPNPLRDFLALAKLVAFFLQQRPDVVHTQTPKAGLLGMLAAWITGVPVRLHTVGGLRQIRMTGWRRVLLDLTERITYAAAQRIYPNSKGLCRVIQEAGLTDPCKLKVLANGSSNGVDTDHFQRSSLSGGRQCRQRLRALQGFGEDDVVFSFVGRVVRDKGIQELVGAFTRLRDEQSSREPKVRLLVVGPLDRDRCGLGNDILSQLIGGDDIRYVGRQDDIRPFLALSDVFLFPSYREGFPNSVMQAGAMGLPVIASDINGCNEIVLPGENGLLVAPEDEVALLEAMRSLARDPWLRQSLAERARPLVVDRYSQSLVWAAIDREYDELLAAISPTATSRSTQ